MNIRHLLVILSLTVAALAATAAPAAASCAMPEGTLRQRLNDAPIVFVGTVDSVDPTGRIANVIVESVWSGDVAEHVQVRGGPEDPQMATSVDRGFESGTRYLFAPPSGDGEVFEDNICSDTQAWTGTIERHRPEDAAAVSGAPPGVDPEAEAQADTSGPAPDTSTTSTTTSTSLGWIVAAAALALLALGAVVVVRRRGETSAS